MRTKVSEQGLIIPKQWFDGIDEVEIRRENNIILIVPINTQDPIRKLGKQPITIDVSDASADHDRYLYDT